MSKRSKGNGNGDGNVVALDAKQRLADGAPREAKHEAKHEPRDEGKQAADDVGNWNAAARAFEWLIESSKGESADRVRAIFLLSVHHLVDAECTPTELARVAEAHAKERRAMIDRNEPGPHYLSPSEWSIALLYDWIMSGVNNRRTKEGLEKILASATKIEERISQLMTPSEGP
jgi:hypothetical protein